MNKAPEFVITNDPQLGKFWDFDLSENGEFETTFKVDTFSEYVNYVNTITDRQEEGFSFVLTSKDIGLLDLDYQFGEEFETPKMTLRLVDPERKFEKAVFKAATERLYNLIPNTTQFYVAFGMGDDLRYWSNFIIGNLISMRRTEDPTTLKVLTIELVPAFGVGDQFLNNELKLEVNDKDGVFNYSKTALTFKRLRGGAFNFRNYWEIDSSMNSDVEIDDSNFVSYLTTSIYNCLVKNNTKDPALLEKFFKEVYNCPNLIFAFDTIAVYNLIKNSIKKITNEFSYSSKATWDNQRFVGRDIITIFSNICNEFRSDTLTSNLFSCYQVFSNEGMYDSDNLYLGYNLDVKFDEIKAFIERIKEIFEYWSDASIELIFYKEQDSLVLEAWKSLGYIEDSSQPCLVFGDKKILLEKYYGLEFSKEKPSSITELFKSMNQFDVSLYGMNELSESKILSEGIRKISKEMSIPILKYNQKLGNVISMEVDENFAYFNAFLAKLSTLNNYSSIKSKIHSGDFMVAQYTDDFIDGYISVAGQPFNNPIRNSTKQVRKLSELSVKELMELRDYYLGYSNDEFGSFLRHKLKVGDQEGAYFTFKENFTTSYVGPRYPQTKIRQARDSSREITTFRKSIEETEKFLRSLFDLLFNKLINESALLYYIEREIQANPVNLEFDFYKQVYKGAFKLTLTTLPFYKFSNFSYMLTPFIFLYDELPLDGYNRTDDLLSGVYRLVGIKHQMSSGEMNTIFIMRKLLGDRVE